MRILVSTVALVACTSLASAADLGGPYGGSLKDEPIAAAPFSWTGLYVGAHAGWADGGWDGRMAVDNAPVGFDGSGKSLDDDGWLGGLQIGFNRQHGSFVWGLEADVSWADLNGGAAMAPIPAVQNLTWTIESELEVFGSVRARAGFLVTPSFLVYGTGGFAWAKASMDHVVTQPRVTGRGSADENHIGWVAGLGGEYMLGSGWSVRGEWLHFDLGKEDYRLAGTEYDWQEQPVGPYDTDSFPADLSFDVFRVGVNYKFGR